MKDNEHAAETPKFVGTEPIYNGRLINLEKREYRANGHTRQYEIIVHPGAAVIFATPAADSLVLVEQWREAAARRMWEVPAGVVDPGEEPLGAAARELREETGFQAKSLTLLWGAFSAPGFSTEHLAFFHASELTAGERDPDEGEESMTVRIFTLSELQNMIAGGEIADLKTLAAIYWLADRVARGVGP